MSPIVSFRSGTLFVNWGPFALEFHWTTLALVAAVPAAIAIWWFSRSKNSP
jgi:hypothetical protein